MMIIELFNETTIIQRLTQEEADETLAIYEGTEDPAYQNLQQRQVELVIIPNEELLIINEE
jgi:hypothetical protein